MINQLTDALDAGNTEAALQLVAACPMHRLNELDKYGYPPIARATINNQYAVAQALLNKGGINLDQVDVMGRTALFWAVESNLTKLIELFLKQGANPNHADGSKLPLLAYPILRREDALKKLLIQRGAKLQPAQDVINCKLLGHRFELPGFGFVYNAAGDYVDISFEGFIPEFSLQVMSQSLSLYTYHADGQVFKHLFPQIYQIADALNRGFRLRQFKHHIHKHIDNLSRVRGLLDQDLIILPITYEGHAISMVFLNDLFAKCDRGEQSQIEEPIGIHLIRKTSNVNKAYFYHLLYERLNKFLHFEIYKHLQLGHITALPTHSQIVGNCSWANTEASILASLFMLLFQQSPREDAIESLVSQSVLFYKNWQEWDKDIALDVCCQTYLAADEYRQKAIATVLMPILALRLSADSQADIARGKQIIQVLKGTVGETLLQKNISTMPLDDPDSHRFAALLKKIRYPS